MYPAAMGLSFTLASSETNCGQARISMDGLTRNRKGTIAPLYRLRSRRMSSAKSMIEHVQERVLRKLVAGTYRVYNSYL